MSKDEFADMLARSLEERPQLLKILSMNHYDMETGSRAEHLAEFKVVYGESLRTVMMCLDKYFPDMAALEKQNFIYIFSRLCSAYIHIHSSPKTADCNGRSKSQLCFMTIYEITYSCVRRLLNC